MPSRLDSQPGEGECRRNEIIVTFRTLTCFPPCLLAPETRPQASFAVRTELDTVSGKIFLLGDMLSRDIQLKEAAETEFRSLRKRVESGRVAREQRKLLNKKREPCDAGVGENRAAKKKMKKVGGGGAHQATSDRVAAAAGGGAATGAGGGGDEHEDGEDVVADDEGSGGAAGSDYSDDSSSGMDD